MEKFGVQTPEKKQAREIFEHYECLDIRVTKRFEGGIFERGKKEKFIPLISMFVSLNGWQTRREIREVDGMLFFEVAEEGHCSICQSRISRVKEVIARKQLQATGRYLHDRYPSDARTLWVGLEKPKAEMSEEEVKDFFRVNLELPII